MNAGIPEKLIGDMRGVRYGEVLALYLRDHGLEAEVFGTQLLNDCPQELWETLDAEDLVVDTTASVATVLQDEYENSYTLPH